MKKHIHRVSKFVALILISSVPLPYDAFADDIEKKQSPHFIKLSEKSTMSAGLNVLTEKKI